MADLCDTYEGTHWDGHNNVGCWACDEDRMPDTAGSPLWSR